MIDTTPNPASYYRTSTGRGSMFRKSSDGFHVLVMATDADYPFARSLTWVRAPKGHTYYRTTNFVAAEGLAQERTADLLAGGLLADEDGELMADLETLRAVLPHHVWASTCERVDVCPVHFRDLDGCLDDGLHSTPGTGTDR